MRSYDIVYESFGLSEMIDLMFTWNVYETLSANFYFVDEHAEKT